MIDESLKLLRELRYDSGLFSAAKKNVKTGYDKAWIRDNIYCTFGLESYDNEDIVKTFQALLDIFLKYEYKINYAIKHKPVHAYEYIHARYNPLTFQEYNEEWGNKQNDAVGAFLFKIAELIDKDLKVIRNMNDLRIIQKLVFYLESIEYWHDKDNGIWEENEEVHASSIGACLAGLKAISKHVYVPLSLIKNGEKALNKLLPRESETKDADLALLSLIYPFNIMNKKQAMQVLENIEKNLAREKGVIRYLGDKYYNLNGLEAEWCFGFPWLAIIYKELGIMNKYYYYLQKSFECLTENYEMPELYFGNTDIYNENTPLGWGQSLLIVAVDRN
ncbi:glycoside hydrolase family 15 [Candidatus Woesearchaeota archaeon]|nr:glycoside hydrolase family 15 [Candidatus Woesearchaeota archaeon]